MREFHLINSRGHVWDLNTAESFFQNPSGLGFEKDNDYEVAANTFTLVDSKLKQPKIKGEINFSGYAKYDDFVLFAQHTPLKLRYLANKEYVMECLIEKIEKGELNEVGRLVCDIEIVGISPFYKEVSRFNEGRDGGKKYEYQYPHTYTDETIGIIRITVDSAAQSGIKLYIFGPCQNPSWSQFVDGQRMRTGKINAEIPEGNRLLIDTTAVPFKIHEVDRKNSVIADRYQDSDFTTERFIFLEPGENVISITEDGIGILNVAMEGRINYETV